MTPSPAQRNIKMFRLRSKSISPADDGAAGGSSDGILMDVCIIRHEKTQEHTTQPYPRHSAHTAHSAEVGPIPDRAANESLRSFKFLSASQFHVYLL